MRERTPSADDTPKRAPPAPPGEADVAVRKARDAAAGCGASKMVASTHRLDELGARHVASQQHQQHRPAQPQAPHQPHHHPHQQPQSQHSKSAQDKRSRLSSVINNLRHKKVVEEGQQHVRTLQEPASAAHGSGTVGRNLETTLETYVMTVLSGVIDAEEAKPSDKEQEAAARHEAQPAPPAAKEDAFSAPEAEPSAANGSQLDAPEDEAPAAEAEAAAPRSLGAIILERITEAKRPDPDAEIREVCRELIDDLLGELLKGDDDGTGDAVPEIAAATPDPATQSLHCSLPLDKVASVLPAVTTAAAPEAAPTPEQKPSAKPASPTVRHLCLYCDRKFLSISLRQRHTERVHQASGGRRSERNSRKPGQQSCQYCVDQCPGNLEGLFQHMVGSHSDKYHGCLQCCTRYLTRDALTTHIHETHGQEKPAAAKEAKQSSDATVKEEVIKQSPAASPEFDTSFYSSVSCNIRENLLHHIDGKLQAAAEGAPAALAAASPDAGGRTPQYQLPIDISLTAVTPVYSKDYPTGPEDYKNSSEYAGKPGKSSSRAHPRRVSFEKYNFPRKYDGKEQWNCTLKDLSKFDISTQLTLRKKQRLVKEQLASPTPVVAATDAGAEATPEIKQEDAASPTTVFSSEFESFMRLKKRSACTTIADDKKDDGPVCSPAELTGEWSRPRVYICGACAERYITLKELEEHKSAVHPNVWCMHFEFSGDQRELYKHLVFLPGRCASPAPSVKTRQQTGASQQSAERVCTKCAKSCASLAELHRHMLECGGDQAWLLGLFGNGKKKCKWRPFGSRSRRRRQRGMKRNIQNSQTPRNVQPRERPQHTGPRVRPSDRESIQKMLANLPAKRATRKVLQENAARSQGRLRNVQSRAGAAGNPASRMVKNKAVLRNKLLKNAKSFQRKKNLREGKSQAAAAADSTPPVPAGVGRPRKLLSRNAWLLGNKKREEAGSQPERKLRGAPEVKRPVGRPKSTETDPEQADKRRRRMETATTSLNASLKARLQLRTNDGKFARVEKKKNVPLDGKSVKIGRRPLNDPARLLTRSKLRAAAKLAWKEHTRISHRVTRLRSLDEKQQFQDDVAQSEETVPAPRGRPPRGVSRNSTLSNKSLDGAEKATDEKPVERASPAVRGRRPKKVDAGESKATLTEEQSAKVQPETELKTRSQKASAGTASPAKFEFKTRRSGAAKEAPAESSKKNARADDNASPSSAGKDDKEKIGSTTRSNSRIKRDAKEKYEMVEDKKAMGSKDSEKKLSKRGQKIAENVEQQTEASSKKEKSGVLRKSPRNRESDAKDANDEAGAITAEKTEESRSEKNSEKVTGAVTEESNSSTETAVKEDVKIDTVCESVPKKTVTGKRGRGRTKRVVEIIDAPKSSEVLTVEVSKSSEPPVIESVKSNDVPVIEPPKPLDVPAIEAPKPSEASAIKPSEPTEAPEIEPSQPSEAPLIEPSGPSEAPANDLLPPAEAPAVEHSKSAEASVDIESPKFEEPASAKENVPTEEEKTDEVSTETSVQDDITPKNGSVSLPNISLEHLQQESSNSNMDSGKENSAESLVNASKLKVVRPKKARGARKDGKTNKRSLNSVIGILTEGVNVPAESAQETSIVLTAQTNPESESNNQGNPRANDEQIPSENSSDVVAEANSKVIVETSDAIVTEGPLAKQEAPEMKKSSEVEVIECKPKEESKPVQEPTQEIVEIVKVSENDIPNPVPKKMEEEAKPIVVSAHQPANDIILDLTRRKPKVKGSFLEKIVSKIAKKKDVSLDGDSTCSFDIVHSSTECQNKAEVVEPIIMQKCNSTKQMEEIKVESLLDKEASVKLNESTMVNIVNSAESTTILDKKVQENVADTLSKNEKISDSEAICEVTEKVHVAAALCVETAISENNKTEGKEILNGAIETVEINKPLIIDAKLPIQNVAENIVQEENKEENKEEKVDVPEKEEEMEVLENKEEKVESENLLKQKSKKRSLESSSPKKNKKKPVDNEEVEDEEDREELCLADIMKLIDRPKSKEAQNESGVDAEQEAVKPGKRKTPDDDTEPDSANVSIDDSLDQKKESTRKSKRKGAQKKNKREFTKVENENDSTNEIKSSDSINVSLENPIKDNVELKVVNESQEVATEKESAITIGPITGPVKEAKTLDTEPIDAPIVDSTNINGNSDKKLSKEKIEEAIVDLPSSTPKDGEKGQKISKRKRRLSKKNMETSEISEHTDKSPTNVDDESFKVPEMTEVAKPSKKRISRRKNNRSTTSDLDLEKDEDDIPDEKSDFGSDFAFDQNSSMSESEDRATPKRTSRRITRNSRLADLEDVLIKESDDSDVSSANEMETSRRRRSQRKTVAVEVNRDLSENSIDESASTVEIKVEKKRKPGRKPKKSAPLEPEVLELANDSEVPVEPEDEIIKKTDAEEMSCEKIEQSVNEVEEELKPSENTVEQKNELKQITHNENAKESSPVEEDTVAQPFQEEDKVSEIEKSDEKSASTPESQSSSLEETPDESDDKHQRQEMSASELEESGSLEPHALKKRPAGNFSVVTKSGKILIVEKKKKLTKEAPKFFCEVCATSFTRKSSLKKHNLSQSHILQMTVSGDKDSAKLIQEAKDAEKMENDGEKDSVESEEEEEDDSQHPTPRPAVSCEIGAEEKLLSADDSRSRIIDSVSPHSLIIPEPLFAHRSPQEQLEDEMLDEEICKITENMSHDEYVLTDHVSPVTPEATSTPTKQVVAPVIEIQPEPEAKIAPKKKRKEKRKKNLADEHLDLNTPVPTTVSHPDSSLLEDSTIENTVDDETTGSEEKEFEKVNESSTKIDDVQTTSKKERRSTKFVDRKSTASDSRRVSRNKNQNVLQEAVTVSENSRPKRNQLRPSYKEDEHFDFDMDFPEDVSIDEFSKFKRDKNNASAIEVDQSDTEKQISGKRSKQTSRSRRDKSNISFTETEISDIEKDVTINKQRGRKSQSKKKLELSEKDDTIEFDSSEKPSEEKVIDENVQTDIPELKIDSSEKSVDQSIEDKVIDEQMIVPPKKKRGRKPKQQVQAEKESSDIVESTPVENAEIILEELKSTTDVEAPVGSDDSATPNQKQQKSKKNQNKRKKKRDAIRDSIDDERCPEAGNESIISKEEQEDDGVKLKSDILLESALETTTNTDLTELSIPIQVDPSDDAHSAPVTKVTDGLKAQEEAKTDLTSSLLGGFDSDDNSLDTDMSVDIQKLLDDPEMTTEIAKQPDEDSQIAELPNGVAPVDVINVKEPELPVMSATAKDEENTQEIANEVVTKKSPKTVQSAEKKGKRRGRKAKSTSGRASSPSEASGLEDEEDRRKNDKVQKSKNKIVKSVFGRVFGEKVDKVREVLDDWQSRSENDSSDSDASEKSTARRSRSRPKKKSLRGRKSNEASSRSRQSKRRAEELISRAFDDSPLPDDERLRQSRRHHRGSSPSRETTEEEEQKPTEGKSSRRKKSAVRSPEPDVKLDDDEEDEEPLPEKSYEESQSSMDKPLDSEFDNTDIVNEAPAAYSSDELRFSASSGAESAKPRRKRRKNRRRRKSATRLLASSQDEEVDGPTEVVTIGPTDALEDNALDLEMPAAEKPRPATKVLNFDEELFVECCSRLKATSEKELRGAKKIKLDHSGEQMAGGSFHHHHRRDEPVAGYRAKDRWRDVESQNSLGSLLESVNQLLGEEYNSREKEYATTASRRSHHHRHHHHHGHHHHHHHGHHHHHQQASRSPSPEGVLEARTAVEDGQLGYDDSLDVAFEHNNKLRDKIQQRMRESESLIATSFGHKHASPAPGAEAGSLGYHGYDYEAGMHSKPKINNGLGGLLDKALSNLLHHNEKHDHNGSTPMNLLAELACARAPTSTTPTVPEKIKSPPHRELVVSTEEYKQPHEHHHHHHHHHHETKSSSPKKLKNPIKELFERKKEFHEKRHVEKVKTGAAKSAERSKKQKKAKSGQHNIPLIRTSQYRGGMAERKKRRDSSHKKEQARQDTNVIKDVYDFDEEESMSEPPFASVLSYRAKTDNDKGLNMSSLLSKTIGDTLTNGKSISAMGQNLESMVDRKFKDIEKLAPKSIPKTPTADDKTNQQNVIGPMDEFVERRQKSKRSSGEHSASKHSGKSKKKSGKGAKKKSRNAWYEDDSSDEFVTKLKADDIGVGISKSQRTCSKGKQNLFAEMSSTSSESEFEREVDNDELDHFEPGKLVIATEPPMNEVTENLDEQPKDKESLINDESQNAESQEDWPLRTNDLVESRSNSPHLDLDNAKKSESEELSDHPLVIDENEKDPTDEQRTNSDDETERRTFELDDLYREDSSIVDSDRDELSVAVEDKSNSLIKLPESSPTPVPEKKPSSDKNNTVEKYISLEDALELLDPPEKESSPVLQRKIKSSVEVEQIIPEEDSEKNNRLILENLRDEEEVTLPDLPEKLSGNEKPKRESENLPLHVFLSRKVQESKKRKQQQELKKLMEEQERIMLDLQPTRRQRKCAIGKQGLLAEISSSDDEVSTPQNRRSGDKMDKGDKSRSKQKQRESKEKRKERYIEKKHEQMIAKEQKAIEEAILRELEEKRLSAASEASGSEKDEQKLPPAEQAEEDRDKITSSRLGKTSPTKHAHKQKSHEKLDEIDNSLKRPNSVARVASDSENDELNSSFEMPTPKKKRTPAKSPQKAKKKPDAKTPSETKKARQTPGSGAQQRRSKSRPTSASRGKDIKEPQPRSSSGRRESDLDGDEELKAAKSWNRLDEGVGVAIGRRKRAAANQLYYWSSSSDDEVELAVPASASAATAADSQDGQEDDRQEQHGWIVGDSHKKMITMLAMEKQMKDKRRRSENDEQSPDGVNVAGGNGGKGKSKKHRNSTS